MKKKSSKPKTKRKTKQNSIFQKVVLFGSSILGIVTILVISIILVLFSIYAFGVFKQNQKFRTAKKTCGRDPVVVTESVDWLFENKSYEIYTPENPEYENVKTSVSGYFSSTKVYGYYCSLEEARNITKNTLNYISDNEDNYTTEEKQKIVNDYVISEAKKGTTFSAPTEQLRGYKENVKVIRPEFDMYNIGYVGNTPETQGSGEQVPINLICKITKDKGTIGDLVDTHPNGGGIYLEEDLYNLNVRYYLPSVICSLETKVGELNKQDAVNLMKSIIEVDPSQIANYQLQL